MLKSILSSVFIAVLLVACSGDASKGGSKPSITASLNVEDLVQIQQEFIECKEASTEAHSCKEFVSKSMAVYYGYEFMGANEVFLPYDKVVDAVVESSVWEDLGSAKRQSTLDLAQKNANNGIPTLAVNADNKTVAIVINGKLTRSNSLGLDLSLIHI